jgi:phosphoenolpyruvate carboxykinase (ATP)
LDKHGIYNVSTEYWNLSTGALYEEAVRRREGLVAHKGPLAVRTGHHTGRAARDKFIVREPSSEDKIWWGDVNHGLDEDLFDRLHQNLLAYLQNKDVFIQDCYTGADPTHQMPIRVISESAWHSLFARNMFVNAPVEELVDHTPQFTVIDLPRFHAVPEIHGTRSETFIIIHFGLGLALIGGTSYAGEIKKSVFTAMNYLLPQRNILSMHCSANVGKDGDVAVFFGLSGTGKTSLSADPDRPLVGDDEHGWSDDGVFNFEGGCYAKVIRLSPTAEPEIYACTRKFGTILENVTIGSADRRPNLDDDSLTENTRASYPITHLENYVPEGYVGHPRNVMFLTADAFGVMPPISRLTPEQAMYHFLSGYTAKVAGTEKGVGKEPQATFSTCFGAPFLPLHPSTYASLLGKKIARHDARVWLVNTGWTGGPYGVGSRIYIGYTRAMVRAALSGDLDDVPMVEDPNFRVQVPTACPNVPSEVLNPRNTWEDKEAYDRQARKLAAMFRENFEQYAPAVSEAVRASGPAAG